MGADRHDDEDLDDIDIDSFDPDEIDELLGDTPLEDDLSDDQSFPTQARTLSLILSSDSRFMGGQVRLFYKRDGDWNIAIIVDRYVPLEPIGQRALRILRYLHDPGVFDMMPKEDQGADAGPVQIEIARFDVDSPSGHMRLQAQRTLTDLCSAAGLSRKDTVLFLSEP